MTQLPITLSNYRRPVQKETITIYKRLMAPMESLSREIMKRSCSLTYRSNQVLQPYPQKKAEIGSLFWKHALPILDGQCEEHQTFPGQLFHLKCEWII
jgi:hypothetical protein